MIAPHEQDMAAMADQVDNDLDQEPLNEGMANFLPAQQIMQTDLTSSQHQIQMA